VASVVARTRLSVWVIPVIDMLTICAAVAIGRAYLLDRSARAALAQIEPLIERSLAVANKERAELGIGETHTSRKFEEKPSGVIARLATTRAKSVELGKERAELDQEMVRLVRNTNDKEYAYWIEQAQGLGRPCVDSTKRINPPPEIIYGEDLATELANQRKIRQYGNKVAELVKDCTATIPVSLTDQDLTFRFGSASELNMSAKDARLAVEKIRNVVDSHPQHREIYIAGHTDYIGGPGANYPLSEGRAKYVADIIRAHLNNQRRVEGIDYHIHIERRGAVECSPLPQKQPPTPKYWQHDEEYRSKCRKIVLRFQKGIENTIGEQASL
jgi:outer membrane protein OmpA-like peptidoglycan-associated protein